MEVEQKPDEVHAPSSAKSKPDSLDVLKESVKSPRPSFAACDTPPHVSPVSGRKVNASADSLAASAQKDNAHQQNLLQFRGSFSPHSLIEPEKLGDLLEIYSFYHHFNEIFDSPLFQLEELFVALDFCGEQWLDFAHDIHIVVIEKMMKETEAEAHSESRPRFPWLSLLMRSGLKEHYRELVLRLAWPQLMKEQLCGRGGKDQSFLEWLAEVDPRDYNALPYQTKMEILLRLINSCSHLNDVRTLHQKLHEKVIKLTKRKVELATKAKQLRRQEKETQEQLKRAHQNEERLTGTNIEQLTELQLLQKQTQRLSRSSDKNNQKLEEYEQNMCTVKRDLVLCIHTADFIGRDADDNALFVFAFDQAKLFSCSKDNRRWLVAAQPIANLLPLLEAKDKKLAALGNRLAVYNGHSNYVLHPKDYYLTDILKYKSLYDQKTGKKKSADPDDSCGELWALLRNKPLSALLEWNMLRALVRLAESRMNTFLATQRMEWIQPGARAKDFDARLDSIETYKAFSLFVGELVKSFMRADEMVTDDEECIDQSEGSEVDFRRLRNRKASGISKRYKRRAVKVKFWGYTLSTVKPLFEEFALQNASAAGAFFLAILLAVFVLRFIATRVEKDQRRKQLRHEQQEREAQREAVVIKAAPEVKKRGRRKVERCAACDNYVPGEAWQCFSCAKVFHAHCAGDPHLESSGQWRCITCREMINNLRMTRNMRKRLRVDE